MPLNIEFQQRDESTVRCVLANSFSFFCSGAALENEIASVVKTNDILKVELDLAKVNNLDHLAVRRLIVINDNMRRQNKKIIILNPSPFVLQFQKLLDCCQT